MSIFVLETTLTKQLLARPAITYRRFDLKWAEDEPILRMFLRRIGDRRSPISNEIATVLTSQAIQNTA